MPNPFPSQTREALRKNPFPTEVALELDMDISTVYRHAQGMDLKLLRALKELKTPYKDVIKLLVQDGGKPAAVARRFGVTVSYVSEVLKDDE